MNDKNFTTLGRTKLRYENGVLVSQELPESAYNRPVPELPTRPKRPASTPLAEILTTVESIEQQLVESTAAYERSLQPGCADPFLAEKLELVKQVNALRAQLAPLEARLSEINNTPPPAVQYRNSIARFEQAINGAAMQLTNALAETKSEELHLQPLTSLSRETQKQILNRRDVSVAKDISAPSFVRFNRVPEEVRDTNQAKATAGRIIDAIKLIADTIKKHLS